MMTLFYSPNSPFVRKVRICALEKGVMEQITPVISAPMKDEKDLHTANPLGKIPALTLENGENIFDSPVICAYLDSLSTQNPLIPTDKEEKLRVMRTEALADGLMDACVARFLELMRPENERSANWIGRWERAIARSLDFLENGKQIPLPETFDIGAIALAAALDYITLRYDSNWKETHPKTASWLEKQKLRPSMIATAPQP